MEELAVPGLDLLCAATDRVSKVTSSEELKQQVGNRGMKEVIRTCHGRARI